ncbi:RNA-binding protein [Methylopila sp. M107]|uniref:RNA-binding protein n=1 Tax=Methylopila sp. M107 TaxID=1101190 RepID=UPI0003707F1C|nr:RNA-binding protein [Methylopila sp. M107]
MPSPEFSGDAGSRASGVQDDLRDDRKAPERTCVATREVRPADELIRFVRAPDGTVVPDLKRALPGRGVWVTATADSVRLAVKRKAFARGFKGAANAAPDLDAQVAELLLKQTLAMLGFVNKAGLAVAGFSKVESALAEGRVAGLVHASDAADDGVRKVSQAARRHGQDGVASVRLFSGEQLDLALGRSNVVHAAVLVGPVSAAFLARCDAYARYLGMDRTGPDDGPGQADDARPSNEGSGDRPAETDRA